MMATEVAAPPIWRDMPVPVIAGLSDTRKKAGLPYAVRPLGDVLQANTCQLPKESAPAFLPSLYAECDARAHEAQRARGRFVALVGDIDNGDQPLERVRGLVESFAQGSAWVIYSTASAQPSQRRWRVILPLEGPISFTLWYDAQLALTAHMTAGGIEMDTCAARPGQVSFLPNVPSAMRDSAGDPIFFERAGTALDAPGLQLHSGPVANGIAAIERKRVQDDAERDQIRQQAEARRKSRPAHPGDDSVIDTFNRSVSLDTLLTSYGYEQSPRDGRDWRSPNQSSGTFATRVMDGGKWVSLSGSDAAAGLGTPCSSGSFCFGDAFDLFIHYEHGGDRKSAWKTACEEQGRMRPWQTSTQWPRDDDPRWHSAAAAILASGDMPAANVAPILSKPDRSKEQRIAESPEDRRKRQCDENVAIGDASDTIPTATLHTLDEMIARFVLIKDGSQVAPIDRPQSVLALADFKNAMAASKHWIEVDGKKKALSAVKCWLESPERKEADALTFRAGGSRMTTEPGTGKAALNLWADHDRSAPPADWKDRASLFIKHIAWLWGDDSEAFLDWLAHIEQRPGVLPHYGWVHISREHGKGRNWISSTLTRVWSGYVAASLDLIPILDGGFNGRISRKLLAIVDEINEGGSTSFRHAQKLRQIVTEEQRDINPKYGRQRVEYNSCRWLMFSNHTGALPLTEDDRRFWIVSHEGAPRDGAYYTRLYEALSDPQFISSVAEYLRRRDLSNFRPGQRPPMNRAKSELIAFSQSEEDATLKAIATRWPVEVITALEITNTLGDSGPSKASVRHAMDRAGIRKLPRKVRVYGQGAQHLYAIKRFHHWSTQQPDALRDEIDRALKQEKQDSLDLEDAPGTNLA